MKPKTARARRLFRLVFLDLGAIGGGDVLIVSPSGKWMGMPLSMLDHSPFTSFLIPGIILFAVLGLIPGGLVPDQSRSSDVNALRTTYPLHSCTELL